MTFIFRNNTIEFFFSGKEYEFSGYEDISYIPQNADQYIWFYQAPFCFNGIKSAEKINSYLECLEFVLSIIPNTKQISVFTLFDIYSVAMVQNEFSYSNSIMAYNQRILELENKLKNLKIIDTSDFFSRYKKNEIVDWKYYFLSQMPFNPKFASDFKKWFALKKESISLKRKKCLVLDLDNTLWGGILGEDGINGIKIGGDYPGKAYSFFQKGILELSKNGVILAVCSKNNEKDVFEAWNKNKNILITSEQLSTYQINWNDKATNLQKIASDLNIGLDSIVFVDDNPSERELIKNSLPMVEVPDFPTEPYFLPVFFKDISEKYFSTYELTDEDKNKSQSYKAIAARKKAECNFSSFDEFIKSLEIELRIDSANDFSVPRISQMTQKTNQFNLTTKRYTEQDIFGFISSDWKIYTLSVKDKFGDEGITGVIFITPENVIDTFLMSCRVLGKGIEKEFLLTVLSHLPKQSVIHSVFSPSSKNGQTENFYENNGFQLLNTSDTGRKEYELKLSTFNKKHNKNYKVYFGGIENE